MVPNYDVFRVALEHATLESLRKLVAHVQRPQANVMKMNDYAAIILIPLRRRK